MEADLAGLKILPVCANNRTGQTSDLATMARSVGALAAVNGSFFNAYDPSDMVSWGTLLINGELYRLGNSGGALIITNDNRVTAERIKTKITGRIDGPSKADLREWEDYLRNWYAWDINRNLNDPAAIVIFTPRFGQKMISPTATTVTVRQGIVTSIQSGPVPIPADGYVIGLGTEAKQYADRFAVGDRVTFTVEITDSQNNVIPLDGVRHIIQAGPLLVKNGQAVLNLGADNLKDPKFYRRCNWSFAGVNRNDRFVMGTVFRVTMSEMPAIMQKLNMNDAIGLDGNASSCLYYNGKYLVKPGRRIANCLAIVPDR